MPTVDKAPRRPWQAKKEAHSGRINQNQKFYASTRWRKIRKIKINNNPLCEICEQFGRITPGDVVDHIQPINQGGSQFDLRNLQTLCHSCHNRKSGRESHK